MVAAAVIGVGMTRFGMFPDLTLKDLAGEAVLGSVKDAGIDIRDIDMAFVSNSYAGLLTGQESVRAQTVLTPLGIGGIPVLTAENACASGSTAFWLAVKAVESGQARYALAVGVEKMAVPDKARTFAALASSRDVTENVGEGAATFMELYAQEIQRHMAAHGTTAEDFAKVAVKNHRNGSLNPVAQFRNLITVAEVLASPPVAAPLTRLMCSPIGDGSAAVIVGAADGHRAAPKVLSTVLRSGSVPPVEGVRDMAVTARRAYEEAGLGPDDIDVAEVHDAAAPAEIVAYEDLGFAAPGQGAALLRAGDTAIGGRLPVNSSGGLKARGHPVGATGLAQVTEIVQQLRGECGARQREGARTGLVHNYGGWVAGAPAATAIHILQAR